MESELGNFYFIRPTHNHTTIQPLSVYSMLFVQALRDSMES